MIPYTRESVEEELRDALTGANWELVEHLCDELDLLAPQPAPVGAAALWYAEQGLPVFPLQPRVKKPYPRTHGVLDATTDPDVIRGWFTTHPDANLGLATGHVVDVIDFDGLKGHIAWGQHHGDSWGGMTVLGVVSTPRPGGLHLYVPATGDGNGAAIYPGVDYRGLGGYVVAPPSVLDARADQHPGPYRFLRPLDLEQL